MWSDPIDKLIAQFGRLLEDGGLLPENMGSGDLQIMRRVHREAEHQRELENETGKVGFEATNG